MYCWPSALLAGCQAAAPSYPTKPIEFVVHSSAGSGSDIMARNISDIMSKSKIVPQTLTVLNKSGGSGAVASTYIGEKKGRSLRLYTISTVQLATPLQKGEGSPSGHDAGGEPRLRLQLHSGGSKSPYKTLQDLVDASKKKPLTQGGGSITSSEAIGGHLIKKSTGAQWEFVSFNSGGEATTALLGGHVDFTNPSPAEVSSRCRAGKLRVLAVNSEKRLDIWPEVPSLKELKIEYPTGMLRGILLPGGVSADDRQVLGTGPEKDARDRCLEEVRQRQRSGRSLDGPRGVQDLPGHFVPRTSTHGSAKWDSRQRSDRQPRRLTLTLNWLAAGG